MVQFSNARESTAPAVLHDGGGGVFTIEGPTAKIIRTAEPVRLSDVVCINGHFNNGNIWTVNPPLI